MGGYGQVSNAGLAKFRWALRASNATPVEHGNRAERRAWVRQQRRTQEKRAK